MSRSQSDSAHGRDDMLLAGLAVEQHQQLYQQQTQPRTDSSALPILDSRRRVPKDLRRRAENSCDRCKRRKIKCRPVVQPHQQNINNAAGSSSSSNHMTTGMNLGPTSHDETTEPVAICQACVEAGVGCHMTLRKKKDERKRRESSARDDERDNVREIEVRELRTRLKAMEALVRDLLPGAPLNADDLNSIRSVAFDVDNQGRLGGSNLARQDDRPGMRFEEAWDGMLDEHNVNNDNDAFPSDVPPILPPILQPTPVSPPPLHIPEGRLLPAPRGGHHYVGPASSIFFAMTVRQLVRRTDLSSLARDQDDNLQRWAKANEFTVFQTSATLEARIKGLPATHVADEGEDGGEAQGNGVGDTIDHGGRGRPPLVAGSWVTGPISRPDDGQPGSPFQNLDFRNAWRRRDWQNVLPPREMTDRYVKTFFDRVHPNLNIFHRSSFYVQYESIWMEPDSLGQGPSSSSSSSMDRNWIYILCMIIVLGALSSELSVPAVGEGTREVQRRYLSMVVREGLPSFALTTHLSNVQTLILLALYQHNVGERNGAWLLLGQATRTAVAMGMHRDGEMSKFNAIQRNTRRLVWWALYTFEQTISLILGRPSMMEIDISTQFPDEEMNEGGLPPGLTVQTVALTRILAKVKRLVASISADYDRPEVIELYCGMGRQLSAEIDAWRSALPHYLRPDYNFASERQCRSVFCLHITANHIQSTLGRPFLLCRTDREVKVSSGAASSSAPFPVGIIELAGVATRAAGMMLSHLHRLVEGNLLDVQTWIDLFYVHHATFILGLPYLTRSLDDGTDESRVVRQDVGRMLAIVQMTSIAPTYRILLNLATQFAYIVGMGPPMETSGRQSADLVTDRSQGAAPPWISTDDLTGAIGQGLPFVYGNGGRPADDQLHPSCHVSPSDVFADLYSYGLGLGMHGEVSWDFFNMGQMASGSGFGNTSLDQI